MKRAQRKLRRRDRSRLMSMRGVVGVGRGPKVTGGEPRREEAVVVLVEKKVPISSLGIDERVPKSLAGLSTDVIEVGEIRLLANTGRHRPARPGCSIGHYRITAGTFGALVRDSETGELLILSNNHVLANITDGRDGRAQVSDAILQPGAYDGGTKADDVVAELERFVPILRIEDTPTCPIATRIEFLANGFLRLARPGYKLRLFKTRQEENLVDAALARPLGPELVTADILELGVPKGVTSPEPGMDVVKSGRTTGVTRGQIRVVDVTLRVMLGDVGSAVFSEQVVTTPMAEPGDSGSLVLTTEGMAVGLLGAGSDKVTILSDINNVLKLLRCEIVIT